MNAADKATKKTEVLNDLCLASKALALRESQTRLGKTLDDFVAARQRLEAHEAEIKALSAELGEQAKLRGDSLLIMLPDQVAPTVAVLPLPATGYDSTVVKVEFKSLVMTGKL